MTLQITVGRNRRRYDRDHRLHGAFYSRRQRPFRVAVERDIAVLFSLDRDDLAALGEQMNGAKKTRDMQAHILTTRQIAGPIKAADDRGVNVRVLTDADNAATRYSSATNFASVGIAAPGAMTLYRAAPQEHLGWAKHLTAEVKTEEFITGKGVVTRWERLRKQNTGSTHFRMPAWRRPDAASGSCSPKGRQLRRLPRQQRGDSEIDQPSWVGTLDPAEWIINARRPRW